MKIKLLFQKKLSITFVIGICGLLFNSCGNDCPIIDHVDDNGPIMTKTTSEFHWECTCGFINGGWKNNCSACGKEYSPSHGRLLLSFMDAISTTVGTTVAGGDDVNRIELPGLIYPLYAPEPWYETATALRFYNALKTLYYSSNREYAEGVDFAWYRTTRTLYPGITKSVVIESLYDKFIVNEGRELKGAKGSGIKDGAKAAIEAFAAY